MSGDLETWFQFLVWSIAFSPPAVSAIDHPGFVGGCPVRGIKIRIMYLQSRQFKEGGV
jgi:hypothetical protein